jgi:hypothetical protein
LSYSCSYDVDTRRIYSYPTPVTSYTVIIVVDAFVLCSDIGSKLEMPVREPLHCAPSGLLCQNNNLAVSLQDFSDGKWTWRGVVVGYGVQINQLATETVFGSKINKKKQKSKAALGRKSERNPRFGTSVVG